MARKEGVTPLATVPATKKRRKSLSLFPKYLDHQLREEKFEGEGPGSQWAFRERKKLSARHGRTGILYGGKRYDSVFERKRV